MASNGNYYGRIKLNGKLIRVILKTFSRAFGSGGSRGCS
jgi:hypothetical protein